MRSFIKKKSHQFSKKFCSYLYMPCTLSFFLKENWFFNQFSVHLIFSVVWELFSPPGSRKLSLAEGKSKEINWKCCLQSSHFQLGNHIGCFSKQLKFCRFTKSLVIFFGFTSHLCEASHRLHSDGEFHQHFINSTSALVEYHQWQGTSGNLISCLWKNHREGFFGQGLAIHGGQEPKETK